MSAAAKLADEVPTVPHLDEGRLIARRAGCNEREPNALPVYETA